MSATLGSIVEALGGTLVGEPATHIDRLAPLASAGPSDLAFLSQGRYAAQLQTTGAAAVIVTPSLQAQAQLRGACIVTDDPYLYFARLTQWWRVVHEQRPAPRIDPLASVDPLARIGQGWTSARLRSLLPEPRSQTERASAPMR